MLDLTDLDKDQLAEYAKTTFNVDLDMRTGIEKLKAQVKSLQEKPKPVEVVKPTNPTATHLLNRNTGFHFPWTEELAKYLTNAVPCDSEGNPV